MLRWQIPNAEVANTEYRSLLLCSLLYTYRMCRALLTPFLFKDSFSCRVCRFLQLQRVSGYIMVSAIFSFLLSVTVETPVAVLERLVFRKRRASDSTSL